MTGSLRLSALLLLLLSRWASADLEKGEDEFVRSWVIIEEQLVPPSRDELLAAGGTGGGGGGGSGSGFGGAGAGRRITPKSVFVAPSFNKCSDGYRPDTMGRCVKVVKLNHQAQWDFLFKQLNSMHGGGGAFPGAYQPAAIMTTTTTEEPALQKTDSPGPFQVNIPLGMDTSSGQTMEPLSAVDESTTVSTTTSISTAGTTSNTTIADDTVGTTTTTTSTNTSTSTNSNNNPPGTTIDTTTVDVDLDPVDHISTAVTTDTATNRPRPYRNRYQTHTAEDTTITAPYESTTATTATDSKTMYVDNVRTTTVGTDDSTQTAKTTSTAVPRPPPSPSAEVTTTTVGFTETEEPATAVTVTTTTVEDEDVVTVLAMSAAAVDDGFSRPPSSSPPRVPSTTGDERIQTAQVTDTATPPEYYDDQPEDQTFAPEPDCSAPNAYRYYAACADFRQQQQQLQQQQQQFLLQQHQQQQQYYQQQQQQQFYQQQQQHHPQQYPQQNHVATALVKRPVAGGGVQVRFPEGVDPASGGVDNVNHIRFPGPAPYRTTNKMYESSRHPTWWPTAQQQHPEDPVVQQQHRLQHHLPQQKQDVRLWEFGSRLPKTTTAVPPPPAPTQWFHRFF